MLSLTSSNGDEDGGCDLDGWLDERRFSWCSDVELAVYDVSPDEWRENGVGYDGVEEGICG